MNVRKIGFAIGSTAAVLLAVACSSSSGDDSSATGGDAATGSDTSTSSDTSTGTDTSTTTCTPLVDGTYAIAYSGPDGGPSCPPANSTITIPVPVSDAGVVDSGSTGGCTTTTDSTTCATTLACDTTTAQGYETKENIVVTPSADGTSATGTYSVTTTQPDGGVLSSCTGVTFTYTKQ